MKGFKGETGADTVGVFEKYDEYSGRTSSDTYDVETLLMETGNEVVLGGPGMGKSTMCKKLFARRMPCR